MPDKTPQSEIPIIDIAPLFLTDAAGIEAVDRRIAEAAFGIGFMTIVGFPADLAVGPAERAVMLKLFELPESERRRLCKRNFVAENSNLYRGLFPITSSPARTREGFEIGPDIVRSLPEDGSDDLLYEPTPLPDLSYLPSNWLDTVQAYYLAMEDIGYRILASLSRSLNIDEAIFRDAFNDGISTLRFLHYQCPAGAEEPSTAGHIDSGLLTVLAQCGVAGLQAQDMNGIWIDVPPRDDGFAINFGGLLECWSGGRIKATRHRVINLVRDRYSVPFFFEPRPNTVISPLPIDGIARFEPFLYGDHLWDLTTKFPENLGLENLRPPRGPYTNPFAN